MIGVPAASTNDHTGPAGSKRPIHASGRSSIRISAVPYVRFPSPITVANGAGHAYLRRISVGFAVSTIAIRSPSAAALASAWLNGDMNSPLPAVATRSFFVERRFAIESAGVHV